MTGIARFGLVALDTKDPVGLANFYATVTGWEIEPYEIADWVQLRADGGVTIACQLAPEHVPPQWPDPQHPQQVHLDFAVEDLDRGEAAVLAAGATKASTQPDKSWRVFLDPAGHPFCLVQT